ncbi:MAG: mechanosensitive ion channel protein MscS [Candidatus Omnitrophica bacterium CG11_big_fil_rev_8_21_14_0_20_63_9]|nr:MAG: mechanosensitive ion channel protein MscS [Candidatus Omnitrophica bacterium CG11_big_fil_rev_8_21_14_0_20_63_9]
MEEQINVLQRILDRVIEFLVNYSFQVVGAILILIAGWVLARWAGAAFSNLCHRRQIDISLAKFLSGMVRLTVFSFAVLVALGKFGITIAPFIAAISALAFGGSFAIQGPISNYGAGFSILLGRPFKVGDTITVVDVSGVVEEVKLAATILTTEDGERITIPNKHIVGEILRNSQGNRVVELRVGISYQDDPQQAVSVIRQTIARVADVAQQPAPLVGLNEFGDSSINIGMRYWVPTKRYSQTRYAVNLEIFKALKQAKITIPFPQRDVRLISDRAGA